MDLSKFNTQNLITKVRAKPRYRNHSNRKPYQKPKELSVVDPQWEVLDPKPDIHALYKEFNVKFFKGKLPEVDLKWSNRVTKGSGITKRTTTGKYIVRLYKPLLDLRPRSTTVEILLHEMIHVYQLTNGRKDWEHGPTFHYHKRRINKLTGANITAYPDYEEEYDLLKRHWWQCNGPCGEIERRTMNRPPSTKAHKRKCGGKFIKISDPEDSPSKKRRKV
ncbi:sprT-like domain-containing protein Spartan [Xenopus tropicalis]|uniref:SprT-like domain-containing protein Spartan n=1 Tax=Xenopus tropicalis TaxID=8364 RepID=A0A8J1J305_XENTR|nr:sprT-like domain-containing protein Spartan [Xenopus tropicalis]XP_031752230.1 sprT-like domain-containing protein Spartan [Xenopus tropicalis]